MQKQKVNLRGLLRLAIMFGLLAHKFPSIWYCFFFAFAASTLVSTYYIFWVYGPRSWQYSQEESILILRNLGVQTSTSSSTYLGAATTRFIPTSKIQDVFIHEAFIGFEVRYYLAIVVEGESEVIVVFPVRSCVHLHGFKIISCTYCFVSLASPPKTVSYPSSLEGSESMFVWLQFWRRTDGSLRQSKALRWSTV